MIVAARARLGLFYFVTSPVGLAQRAFQQAQGFSNLRERARNGQMLEGTTRQILPTATGFAARQAIAVLRKRNIEVAPLLRRVGLSERDVDNRQRRISADAQVKLLERVAEALGDSAFGLHLAQRVNLREAGLLGSMSRPPREPSARRCRFMNATVGSSTKQCA